MTFGRIDGPMFTELFGTLVGLDEEWRAQGASEDEISMVAFDWDYVPIVSCGGNAHPLRSPPVTLFENSEELVQRDFLGRTIKLIKKTATIPLPLDFPVKTMDDWLRLKPKFQFLESRVDPEQIRRAKTLQSQGHLVIGSIPGAFDIPRELMGEEAACLAYYDQPELMRDILQTLSDTTAGVFERVCDQIQVDQLTVHEDLAGRSGPMIGPVQVREFFRPYYRRVWDIVRAHGGRIFQQDTDGNINAIIPALLDCGLTGIYPMEPAAGMDIVALRQQYGERLAMRGGIDKHVLRQSQAAIRLELEKKMRPELYRGMVFGLDHRIPNGTPLENYRYYVRTGREILGLPPRESSRKGC
jgi:uroporphyrinogen-III decarboxylase